MTATYDDGSSDFFNRLASRLVEGEFDVQRQVRSDPYIFEIYAVGHIVPRANRSRTMIILGVGIPDASANGAAAFSSFATSYVIENKKDLGISTFDCNILPVIASQRFAPDVIAWVEGFRPYQKAITDTFEFPVLVSTWTGEIHCFKKTPFLGGLYYKVLRKWAARNIGFEPQPRLTS